MFKIYAVMEIIDEGSIDERPQALSHFSSKEDADKECSRLENQPAWPRRHFRVDEIEVLGAV